METCDWLYFRGRINLRSAEWQALNTPVFLRPFSLNWNENWRLCSQQFLMTTTRVSLRGNHFGKLRKPPTFNVLQNIITTTKCKTTMLVSLYFYSGIDFHINCWGPHCCESQLPSNILVDGLEYQVSYSSIRFVLYKKDKVIWLRKDPACMVLIVC